MYKKILVPIDPAHGEVGGRIMAVAKLLADKDGELVLLTVTEPIPAYVANQIPPELLQSNRDKALDQIRGMAEGAGVDHGTIELREGSPSTIILEEAQRLGCDAIILGSHRPNYSDYLIGSTAARVVRHAQCTVVVERSAGINV